MLRDLKHAVRVLLRSRGWTAVVLLSLALGIGANTALFTAVNGLLLQTVAVPDAGSLVRLKWTGENDMMRNSSDYGFSMPVGQGQVRSTFSYAIYKDLLAANQTLTDVVACAPAGVVNVIVNGEADLAPALGVTGNYFRVLGVPAKHGRLLGDADAEHGAPPAAVISVSSAATARRIGQRLAERLGVAATREAIAAVPVDHLLQAQAELRADLAAHPDPARWGMEVVLSMLPWQPVVDGDVIPAPPLDRIGAGAAAGIDLLAGTNTDEHRMFLVPGGAIDQITVEALGAVVAAYGLPLEATLATYRTVHRGGSPGDLLAAVQTDWCWRIPAIRLADAHAKGPAATYMYEFAWRSAQFAGRLGACHALEIPFVFDTLDHATDLLWGADPPQRLADTMHAAWVAFATTGDCGWPKYDLRRRATMRFDTTSEVVDDPRSTERALWEGVR